MILQVLLAFIVISWSTFQDEPYTFQRGNQKVVLEIENGKKYIKWNQKTKLILTTENINNQKLRLSAPGLRLIKGADEFNNETQWEITPQKKYIKKDTLNLFISGYDLKDSIWFHKFKILIQ